MANPRHELKDEKIADFCNQILEYAAALPVGAAKGVYSTFKGVLQIIANPLDHAIYPVSELIFDASVISAAHYIYVPGFTILQCCIVKDPQIYTDSLNRMKNKLAHLQEVAQEFKNASGPKQIEMLAEWTAVMFVPGGIVRAAQTASKMHKLEKILADPPLFRNPIDYKLSEKPPAVNRIYPEDIKKLNNETTCLYVITEDNELIVALEEYKFKSLYGNEYLTMLNHHNLTRKRVSSAGEVIIKDGKITRIDNESGHFIPHGVHLESHVTSTFKNNGFKGVKGKFVDAYPGAPIIKEFELPAFSKEILGFANIIFNIFDRHMEIKDNFPALMLTSIHLPNSISHVINLHALFVNGKEEIFAMVCQSQGLEIFQFDYVKNFWKKLPCNALWRNVPGSNIPDYLLPQYYETIRTNVITVNGEQKILAMIRDKSGIKLHQFDLLQRSWMQLSNGPAWVDAVGYAVEGCYKTIRTEVITVNGKQKLLAMILCSGGLELHEYHPETNLWRQLAMGPAWAVNNGFFVPHYYETMRTNVITVDGKQSLLAMIRHAGGFDLHQYNPLNNKWTQLNGYIPWRDGVGYAVPGCYKSIRTEVITVDGKQKLLAMILNSGGLELHQYEFSKQSWMQLPNGPAWSIDTGYFNPKYYETISTAVITNDGLQKLVVMIRNEHKIELHQFDPISSKWERLPEQQPQATPAENLIKISYKTILSQIDQRQAEQKAAEERKRQVEQAEQQRQHFLQQQAFFAAQQHAAQEAARQKAIAEQQQKRHWAVMSQIQAQTEARVQASINAGMAEYRQQQDAYYKKMGELNLPPVAVSNLPPVVSIQDSFTQTALEKNEFLRRNEFLTQGNSMNGGPGFFANSTNKEGLHIYIGGPNDGLATYNGKPLPKGEYAPVTNDLGKAFK